MKPLQSLIVKGDMRLQQCLDITVGIAKHLHFIHRKNLMQQDLDTEDIYFRKEKSVCQSTVIRLNPYKPSVPFVEHGQTVQTKIRCRRMQRLIRVSTVFLQKAQLKFD